MLPPPVKLARAITVGFGLELTGAKKLEALYEKHQGKKFATGTMYENYQSIEFKNGAVSYEFRGGNDANLYYRLSDGFMSFGNPTGFMTSPTGSWKEDKINDLINYIGQIAKPNNLIQ